MIYIAYFLLALIFSLFLTDRKQSLFFLIILTFSYMAFSFPSGGDWIGYFTHYNCVINHKCYSDFILFEPSYEFLVKVLGVFGFQAIIIFVALFNSICLYYFSRKFECRSHIVFFIMCMFLWGMYFEAIRQSLAFSLILLSFNSLYQENIKKFIFIVLIASTFHTTALVALIFLVPYFSINLTKFFSFSLLVLTGFFTVFTESILENIISILPSNSIVSLKLQFYLLSDVYKPQLSIGIGLVLDILLILLIIISYTRIVKNNLIKNYKFHFVVLLGVTLYISFSIVIGRMMPVLTRIGWYGFPLILVLLHTNFGNSIFYKKIFFTKNNYLVRICVVLFFLLQTFRPFTYEHSNYGIFQQETIFQNIYNLDDRSLEIAANKKCAELTRLGYGYLCD